MTTLGFIGAGNVNSRLASLLAAHGHSVILSNSREPETLEGLVRRIGPMASAATPRETAQAAEIVFVGIPFGHHGQLPAEELSGRIVVDAMNLYPPRDGNFRAVHDGGLAASQLVQNHLKGAFVVKAFNHIAAEDLVPVPEASASGERRALTVFSDDSPAAAVVADLIKALGFTAVDAGPLSESWRVDYGQPAFLAGADQTELSKLLRNATRAAG